MGLHGAVVNTIICVDYIVLVCSNHTTRNTCTENANASSIFSFRSHFLDCLHRNKLNNNHLLLVGKNLICSV